MSEEIVAATAAQRCTAEVLTAAAEAGADIAGVADLRPVLPFVHRPFRPLIQRFPFAVSLGVDILRYSPDGGIDPGFDEQIIALETLGVRVGRVLAPHCKERLVLHAEDCLDPGALRSPVSNKIIAAQAGLGWIGKCLLLVTPRFGPRVRLVSILTDAPLLPGNPLPGECGECTACLDACPAGSLQAHQGIPQERGQVLDVATCLGGHGCSECMMACPVGRGTTAGPYRHI